MKSMFKRSLALISFAAVAMAACAQPAHAGGMSDYLENKLTDHVFRGQPYTAPAVIHVALYTTACSDAGPGTEVTGGSYARGSLAATLISWSGTQGIGSQTASYGVNATTSNNSAISFMTPTAPWGTVTHVGLTDAVTGGNLLVCASLVLPKTIASGDSVSFPPAAIANKFDN